MAPIFYESFGKSLFVTSCPERSNIYNPVKKLVLDIQSGKTGISMLSYENFGKSMSRIRTKITFSQISPKISHLEYQVLHNSNTNLHFAVISSPK